MNVDEPQKSLDELHDIIQDAWDRVAARIGERSSRLMDITDLPQDDRDLYLAADLIAITCNAGMLAWIHYHHDDPGWIESAQAAFRRIGHPQVSEGLASGLQTYLAKRGSLTHEDGPEQERYIYDHEERIYRSLYRHLGLRHYFSR